MDVVIEGAADFVWPVGGFTMDDTERLAYNLRVRDFVANYLIAWPEARAKYLEPRTQNIVFEQNEFDVYRGELSRHCVYNLALPFYDESVAKRITGYLRAVTTTVQLVNMSFSFIHNTPEPDVFMFKYASHNTQLMRSYMRILTLQDTNDLLPYLQPEAICDRLHRLMLDAYGYCIVALTSVKVDVMTHTLATIGSGSCLSNVSIEHVWLFPDAPQDNKCVYRSIAAHFTQSSDWRRNRLITAQIYGLAKHLGLTKIGRGFDIYASTSKIEEALCLNIRFYLLSGAIVNVSYSTKQFSSMAHMLIFGAHCVYINDISRFLMQKNPKKKMTIACGLEWFRCNTQLKYVAFFFSAPDDGMCAWRALAAHATGSNNLAIVQQQADELLAIMRLASDAYFSRCNYRILEPNQIMFDMEKTNIVEDVLGVNIRWFDITGHMVPVNYTQNLYDSTAVLLVVGQHCVYVYDPYSFVATRQDIVCTSPPATRSSMIGCGDVFQQQHNKYNSSKSVWTFPRSPNDGRCFVRCLAAAEIQESGRSLLLTQTMDAMLKSAQALGLTVDGGNEFDISNTGAIEDWYRQHIRYHEIGGGSSAYIDKIRYSFETYPKTIHLLVTSRDPQRRHYAFVKNWQAFCGGYSCDNCKRLFAPGVSIYAHKKRCVGLPGEEEAMKKWRFISGVDRPKPDMFSKLQHIMSNIKQVERKHRFVFFDIECTLSRPDITHFEARDLKRIEQEHVPVSIALAYSANAWQVNDPKCFVSTGDTGKLVLQFYEYLKKIYRTRHAFLQYQDYCSTFAALMAYAEDLEQYIPRSKRQAASLIRQFEFNHTTYDDGYKSPVRMDDDGGVYYNDGGDDGRSVSNVVDDEYVGISSDECSDVVEEEEEADFVIDVMLQRQLKYVYGLLRYYDLQAYRLNIIGYNSSKYDINALRSWLIPLMLQDGKLEAVKRQHRYLVLVNYLFRFTDIYLFMAPHTKLTDFIKAYLRSEDEHTLKYNHKLEFPYEYLSLDVLDDIQMPAAEYFTSRQNYTECKDEKLKKLMYDDAVEKHALAVAQFSELKCKTLRDYLIVYNKADVSPAVRAIENLATIYSTTTKQHLFDYITLPSLAKQIALTFTPTGGYFMRFTKKDAEIYHDVRNAITGGTSIVWTRLAVAGETKIRPYDYGKDAETVQRIIGLDMSGCYLYATSQEHLTGPYFLRTADHGFKIESGLRNIHCALAIEWFVQQRFGSEALQNLVHEFAGGEKQLMMPDGHVWSVDGYLEWHDNTKFVIEYYGCWFHNHKRGCGLPHADNTRHNKHAEYERHRQIERQVTQVIILHECVWYREMRRPATQRFLQTRLLYHTWVSRKGISHSDIESLIMADKLKGLFEVDAYVPKKHRKDFYDVQPFFYQKDVTWNMIGPVMRYQMQVANRKFKSRRLLLNPPFCEKLFLTHFYIKWLVQHGVIIHRFYRIIEFPLCCAPFAELGELICRERQKAASTNASEADKASADSWKLIGNSIYGQFCMQPDNFTATKYCNEAKMVQLTNLRETVNVDCFAPDSFEATFIKDKVTVKQCPQMAVGVYQHAKLRMLAFEYDLSRLLNRQLYCLILTDTDSYYLALARPTWEECVRNDVLLQTVVDFKAKYFCTSPDKSKYMGLFHKEFEGHAVVALQPKMYYAVGDNNKPKTATRGIKKRDNLLDIETFKRILAAAPKSSLRMRADDDDGSDNRQNFIPADEDVGDDSAENKKQFAAAVGQYKPHVITQRTFKVIDKRMVTVRTTTTALNAFYIKRQVLDNNIDTIELDWEWPSEFNL